MPYRRVLLTGVSTGIGFEMARLGLSSGWTVYAMNRRFPAELAALGDLRFVSCDFADTASIRGRLVELLAGVEQLDLAMLNAGYFPGLSLMKDTPEEELDRMMRINVWANKAILDHLLSTGMRLPQVVAMSSSAAWKPRRGWNGYSMSKAALNVMIQQYAQEETGTHFTALAPGLVETGMFETIAHAAQDPRFPDASALATRRGTPGVPGPREAAARIAGALHGLMRRESGAYVDLRDLPETT